MTSTTHAHPWTMRDDDGDRFPLSRGGIDGPGYPLRVSLDNDAAQNADPGAYDYPAGDLNPAAWCQSVTAEVDADRVTVAVGLGTGSEGERLALEVWRGRDGMMRVGLPELADNAEHLGGGVYKIHDGPNPCRYCGPVWPCRGTARTADGADLERFEHYHPAAG